MRGELDWIVMKSLEKDRNRRYETASSFAADIERHLHDEPVQAGPPSAAYRFRKFARRNKAALIAASVVAVALFLGLVGTTWQAIRATEAERVTQVQRDRALEAEKFAKTEAAIATAVNEFLNSDLLGQIVDVPYDRYDQPRGELKLLTVLDRAAARIDGRFRDQPLIEAALRQMIGKTYNGLGNDSRAMMHLKRAVELRRMHLGEEHPDTLTSMAYLGWATDDTALITRVLEVRRRVLGKDHPDTLRSMYDLAGVTQKKGEKTRAIALFRETLEAQRRALGEDHYSTAWTMHCLASTLFMNAGKAGVPEADDREIESMFRHALAVMRKVHGDLWHTYDITAGLGQFLNSRHRYEEAEALLQDAISRLDSLPGAPPYMAAKLAGVLDAVYRSWGKPERAAEWE
ncbi:MAG: tetratricopeptide repeat protein, partial [Pirellulales bacterium]